MKTNDYLFQLVHNTKNILTSSQTRRGPFSLEFNSQIKSIAFRIKENLAVDFCKQIEPKDIDMDVLRKLIIEYIKTGVDHFDSYFIQLLCWKIYDLKVISNKDKRKKSQLSFFEYQPGLFDFNSATKKLFVLLNKHQECKKQIASALMMIYLNNYQFASEYFIESFKQYLKSIKYFRNINLFFDVTKAGTYGRWRIYNPYYYSFIRRMELFQIRTAFFNTKYFQDAWFYWMKNRANTSNKAIIEDLPCQYFDICTDAEKLMVLSRVIVKNNSEGQDMKKLFTDHLQDLFPVNPFIPENWIFDCSYKDMEQLVNASNIVQRLFVKKPEIMTCSCIDDKITVYRN